MWVVWQCWHLLQDIFLCVNTVVDNNRVEGALIRYIYTDDVCFLDRHAQGSPSEYVSDMRQWLLPDPLGPGELWHLPLEPLLPCECCIPSWGICLEWNQNASLVDSDSTYLSRDFLFDNREYPFSRVQTWTPSCVRVMPSVQRAARPQAIAWRPSSAKQGRPVNWPL